ncbi:MAG: hypothetical protein AAGA62_09345, partial [Bacteroidota bacterium]
MSESITTVSLFHYQGFRHRWWAFTQMGLAPSQLAKISGLQFGKLMGSGGVDGFSILPNFGVYAFLGVWDNRQTAEACFDKHPWWQNALERSHEQLTFFLRPTIAHGLWDGQNPFSNPQSYDPKQPTAVLTRATIRTSKLAEFWQWVPKTSASIYDHPSRLISVGVGEYPLFMQATFSLWESGKAMQEFAYHSKYHKEVVKLTRERNWYKEELFARFTLIDSVGNWSG